MLARFSGRKLISYFVCNSVSVVGAYCASDKYLVASFANLASLIVSCLAFLKFGTFWLECFPCNFEAIPFRSVVVNCLKLYDHHVLTIFAGHFLG